MRRRNVKKQFWISYEDNELFLKNAKKAGLNGTDYFRKLIYDTTFKEPPGDRFYDVMKEMRPIGINLNQIARVANATGNINQAMYEKEATEWNEFMIKVKKEFLLKDGSNKNMASKE